jgi:flagellar hook-length control protein FliK
MKITETLQGVIAPGKNQIQFQNQNHQNGFDLLFADASQINITAPDNRERGGDWRGSRSDDVSRAERHERPNRPNEPVTRMEEATNAPPPADDVGAVDESVAQYEYSATKPKIDEEQAIAAIAAIMQISPEAVVELMNEQGITAQELLDSKAVAKFMQAAFEAESPAELLTDPVFPEKFKAVNEAIGELYKEAEAVVAAQTTEVGAKDVQQKAYTKVEGLEVINEDGKLIVTDESGNEEVYVSASRTQTTREASSATTEQQPQQSGQLQHSDTSPLLVSDEPVVDNNQFVDPMINATTKATEAVQTARATATAQPVNTKDVIEQIMSQVKVTQSGGQFTEMRMTLRPETLGDITLRVLTQNGIVIAQFEAESQRVKEALEADFNQLRDALEEQGIQFSELSVSVRQDENEQMNQFERERQRTRHRADEINGEEAVEEPISYHNGVIDVTA